MKKFFIFLLIIVSLFPLYRIHAQDSNVGFVKGNIWYSKDPFEEGDRIKVYTLIFNPDPREFSGSVVFFDNSTLLGKKDFALQGNGVMSIFVNWTVTVGDHTIFAKIENAKFLVSAGKYEEVYIANNETERNSRSVSKKIIPATDLSNTGSGNTTTGTVQNIENIIQKNTPDSVKETVASASGALENFRNNISTASADKKIALQKEIKALGDKKDSSDKTSGDSKLLKPWKQVQLFFVSLFSFLVSHKYLFYIVSVLLIFFILRYIWRLFF